MITAGFISPIPSLLLPGISDSEIRKNLLDTYSELEHFSNFINESKIDVLVCFCVSSVSKITCNLNQEYYSTFEDFGEFQTKFSVLSDMILSEKIASEIDADFVTDDFLNYRISIPLNFLMSKTKRFKIVPIYIPKTKKLKELFILGKKIRNLIVNYNKNVGVCCFGDISFSSLKREEKDKEIINLIENKSIYKIINLKKKDFKNSEFIAPFCIFSGVFDKINYKIDESSYENYLGMSYFTCNYKI
jgi:aromatic ring-opening dioxygenase catalytic subunit (LigB family)